MYEPTLSLRPWLQSFGAANDLSAPTPSRLAYFSLRRMRPEMDGCNTGLFFSE